MLLIKTSCSLKELARLELEIPWDYSSYPTTLIYENNERGEQALKLLGNGTLHNVVDKSRRLETGVTHVNTFCGKVFWYETSERE